MSYVMPQGHKRASRLLVAGVTCILAALVCGAGATAAADCARLAARTFGHALIATAANAAPPFSVAGKDPPTPVSVSAPFCRVQGVIKPSADSDIKFEVWLPS